MLSLSLLPWILIFAVESFRADTWEQRRLSRLTVLSMLLLSVAFWI